MDRIYKRAHKSSIKINICVKQFVCDDNQHTVLTSELRINVCAAVHSALIYQFTIHDNKIVFQSGKRIVSIVNLYWDQSLR